MGNYGKLRILCYTIFMKSVRKMIFGLVALIPFVGTLSWITDQVHATPKDISGQESIASAVTGSCTQEKSPADVTFISCGGFF